MLLPEREGGSTLGTAPTTSPVGLQRDAFLAPSPPGRGSSLPPGDRGEALAVRLKRLTLLHTHGSQAAQQHIGSLAARENGSLTLRLSLLVFRLQPLSHPRRSSPVEPSPHVQSPSPPQQSLPATAALAPPTTTPTEIFAQAHSTRAATPNKRLLAITLASHNPANLQPFSLPNVPINTQPFTPSTATDATSNCPNLPLLLSPASHDKNVKGAQGLLFFADICRSARRGRRLCLFSVGCKASPYCSSHRGQATYMMRAPPKMDLLCAFVVALMLAVPVSGVSEPVPQFVITTPFPPGMSKKWREAGTPSAEIFAQKVPRQPCKRGFIDGYIEVVHRFSTHYHEKLGLWLHRGNGSGLWYPPRRVLVCQDSLDLAIHLNHSSAGGAWRRPYLPGMVIPQCESDLTCDAKKRRNKAKYELYDFARRALDGMHDTVVLTHHLDVAYAHSEVLVGELFALPSSNSYSWKTCPSSNLFRKGKSARASRPCDCQKSPDVPYIDPLVC